VENNKQVNIQFLRAIAALLVIFYHTSDHFFVVGGSQTGNIFSFIKTFGYIGVDIFFVISGYIIWITSFKYQKPNGSISFIYNRLARIYLGYWPYFILLYLLLSKYDPLSIQRLATTSSFFLMQPSLKLSFLGVAWTLQYELYFYLMFSLLLFIPKKHLVKVLTAMTAVIIMAQIYGIVQYDNNIMESYVTNSLFYTFFTSPFCLEFLAGWFIGAYFEKYRISNRACLFLSLILAIAIGFLVQATELALNLNFGYGNNLRVAIMGSICTILVIYFVELEKRGIQFFPKTSLVLGGASYSLYLSHTIILLAFYFFGVRDYIAGTGDYKLFYFLLVICFIILYSIVHYKLVEKPLLKLSKKIKPLLIKSQS
jgi:peptidoglycan/LPS O-acetylase OafA/YrhL